MIQEYVEMCWVQKQEYEIILTADTALEITYAHQCLGRYHPPLE